jgi:hypothetical protein
MTADSAASPSVTSAAMSDAPSPLCTTESGHKYSEKNEINDFVAKRQTHGGGILAPY